MIKCSCGSLISKNNLFKHLKSTKHIERTQLIKEVTNHVSNYYKHEITKIRSEVDLIKTRHSLEHLLYHHYQLDKVNEYLILQQQQPAYDIQRLPFIIEWGDGDKERLLLLDELMSVF